MALGRAVTRLYTTLLQLGHTQAPTTARYAHIDADPLRRAVGTIGATIAAAMEGKNAGGAQVLPLKRSREDGAA